MSAASVTVDLVHALAWPVVAISAVVLLRGVLRDRLVHAEGFGFSLDFERAAAEVEAATARANGGATRGRPRAGDDDPLSRVAHVDPSGAVLAAYESLAKDLRERLQAAGVTGVSKLNAAALAVVAVDHGVISARSAESVKGLGIMRNLVAHGQHGEVTPEQALEFLELVDGVRYTFGMPSE